MKKQNVLTAKVNGKEIQSKPFDFEALCLINDAHGRGESGAVNLGHYALSYMFKDTAVTDEILDTLSMVEKSDLCITLFNMYIDVMKDTGKRKN